LSNVIDRSLAMVREVKFLCRKDVNMNQPIQAEEERTMAMCVETDAAERDLVIALNDRTKILD